ncbi:GIY-YIG nuclease family protein [candidate division TA06 bacterium]|uniref:GIY-YIG nuclease family protein n=1 Tax=candidate division TA06 bacterium TaxID=2250710 RepID=A0A933IBW9_UNCT6|nr:GIY-YIG nuclease family protein [candidate division TA06 bacterium]
MKQKNKNVLYVGKTKGAKMNFATRLYRHISKKASNNSNVYRCLKASTKKNEQIRVVLLNGRCQDIVDSL